MAAPAIMPTGPVNGAVANPITPPTPDPVSNVETIPINRDSISGRALLDQETIQVSDMQAEGSEYPLSHELAKRFDHRSVVVVPLFREGKPFGTILLRRHGGTPESFGLASANAELTADFEWVGYRYRSADQPGRVLDWWRAKSATSSIAQ